MIFQTQLGKIRLHCRCLFSLTHKHIEVFIRESIHKLVDLQKATKEEISITKDKDEYARRALADQKLQAWP